MGIIQPFGSRGFGASYGPMGGLRVEPLWFHLPEVPVDSF